MVKRKKPKVDFYESEEWLKLSFEVLAFYGRKCMCCGDPSSPEVDHIKPRSKRPDLELDFNNLQVLCYQCNAGKGDWDQTDFRFRVIFSGGFKVAN